IGTSDRGLVHLHRGRTDLFRRADGLSGDLIYDLFEDREGNIWIATNEGLDRFRGVSVSTVSVEQGLSGRVSSVLSGRDRSIWLGTSSGLNNWINGQVTVFRKRNGLSDDSIQSLFQDDRSRIWAARPLGIDRYEQGRFNPASGVPSGYAWSM